MIKPTDQIQNILKTHFADETDEVVLQCTNNLVTGYVSSRSFEGFSIEERQKIVWQLIDQLPAKIRNSVSILLTLTPAEVDVDSNTTQLRILEQNQEAQQMKEPKKPLTFTAVRVFEINCLGEIHKADSYGYFQITLYTKSENVEIPDVEDVRCFPADNLLKFKAFIEFINNHPDYFLADFVINSGIVNFILFRKVQIPKAIYEQEYHKYLEEKCKYLEEKCKYLEEKLEY